MSPPFRVYFHLYASGNWIEPFDDFMVGVKESGLYDILEDVMVGVVGRPSQRKEAIHLITSYGDKVKVVAEENGGWEQVTLDVINKDCQDQDFYCLYGHTKGAAYRRPQNTWWRRDMIRHTVRRWREAVEYLDNGYDAAGIFWRTRPQLGRGSPVLNPHFSGNFWWSKSEYLKTIGPPNRNTRYDAEAWIGLNPLIRWMDLNPGASVKPRTPRAIKRSFSMGDKITVLVMARVMGPTGKLQPGNLVELEDTPYVRILIKSGDVVLVDPPSLDPEFLEKLRLQNVTSNDKQDSDGSVSVGTSDAEGHDPESPESPTEDAGSSPGGHGDAGELVLGRASNPVRKSTSNSGVK